MLEFPNYSAMTPTLSVSLGFFSGLLKKKRVLIDFGLTPYLVYVFAFRRGFFLGLLSCGEKETFYEFRTIYYCDVCIVLNL